MCRPKGSGFCIHFGLQSDIDFAHFNLESGMVFETVMCERFCRFNSKGIRKKDILCEHEVDKLRIFFCSRSYFSNGVIIS